MAETLLSAAAESLIGKLASHAINEASQALGVYHDLEDMKKTMVLIKAFLSDAEQKKSRNNALTEWLRQIKLVFSDAEDIVDDFECEALRRHVVKVHGSVARKVCRFFSTSNPLVYRFRMAREMKDINKRLNKVAANRHLFGLQIHDTDARVMHVREMTHSHVNPSSVIGREHDKQKIIKHLLQDDLDKSLSVSSIVGIGGLGKTTLAKLVFSDTSIEECFPLKLWVCVSNDFELKNLLVKILNSTPNPPSEQLKNFDTEKLQNQLRNTLKRQKFLLVLDDVWNEDRSRWDELKEILDVGVEGCKVLVTTRSHRTAAMMCSKPSYCYFLERLSERDALLLFVKSAFKEGEEEKYPQLLEIGKEIVGKCGGIPLAVRTLGSALIATVDSKEWESIRDDEIWNIPQNEKDIMPALELSYNQLPTYLKPCFACFSLSKEDTIHSDNYFGILWNALGYLPPPNKSETVKEVTIRFLRELRSRSFLTDFDDLGSNCAFKLHDLVRDLAVYVAKGEFQILNSQSPKVSTYAKHLLLPENNMLDPSVLHSGLRTIFFPLEATNEAFLNTVVSRCKYLRALRIEDSEYKSLPRRIGKLKHLRLLTLTGNQKLKGLPDSVCKLQSLQCLDLSDCTELQELPKGIRKLISLRYLSITTRQSAIPEKEIANLPCLETLTFHSCHNLESLFDGIQHFNLKFLYIENCRSLKSLSFGVIKNLHSLMISECDKLDLSMGLGNEIPNSRLKVLCLGSLLQLVNFPQWLQGSVDTLQSLLLAGCDNLEELPEWLSSMIYLKILKIELCPKLLSLPGNMHHLTNLEYLEIMNCPELCKRYQPEVGQDWHKISHIKKAVIYEFSD